MKPPSGSEKTNPKQTQFKPCPELAEALSAAEGAVEWANFFKGQNELKIACRKIWPHPQKRKAQEKSGFFLNSLIYWLCIY